MFLVALGAVGAMPFSSSSPPVSSAQIWRPPPGFSLPAATPGSSVVVPVSGGRIRGESSLNKAVVPPDLEDLSFSLSSSFSCHGGGWSEKKEKLKCLLRFAVVGDPDLWEFAPSFRPSHHGGGCSDSSREFSNPHRSGSCLQSSGVAVLALDQLHQLQIVYAPIFWLWSYWFRLSQPLSPSPRCGEPGIFRLSSVKRPQNLQLILLPPVHKSERPSVEPPAGHQLASIISEALEDSVSCFVPDFSSGQAGGFCRRLLRLLAIALALCLFCMSMVVTPFSTGVL